MMLDVPEPGIYGLVRLADGELRLWRHRGRDSKRTWPIWDAAAIGSSISKATTWKLPVSVVVAATGSQWPLTSADLMGPARTWGPVRFGTVGSDESWYEALQAEVSTRIWWTKSRENALGRAALYMPAMPRDALIELARDLERRADAGAVRINNEKIGVWIRRVWDVLEARERANP